jgi:hypothetical protein
MSTARRLVIDRSRWFCGRGPELSRLLRPTDKLMCCIGIYLESCGVPPEILSGQCYPTATSVAAHVPEHARWLLDPEPLDEVGQSDRTALAVTNDTKGLFRVEREQRIAEIFAKHDVEVVFVDGPSPTGGTDRG